MSPLRPSILLVARAPGRPAPPRPPPAGTHRVELHFPSCSRWSAPHERCTCPRAWRIRRDPNVHDGHPWTVSRLMNDGYETLMRARSFEAALALVRAFTDLEQCLLR